MNCRVAHELLQQSFDGTPIESPEWLEHLRHCAECQALASAGRRLQDGLRLLAAPLPPPDLAERIAQRVLLDRRRTRRRRRWTIGLALAAGLLLALTLRFTSLVPAFRVGTPPEPVVKNVLGGTGGTPVPTADRRDAGPTGHADRRDAGPTGQAAPTLRESAAELGEVFAELSNETAEAGEVVSEGLEPVTTSARRAVDLFLRELPMETETN